jgi:peptidoglycan biosynthesis protein MviN/MurJ (putative lipid II flippase)
VAGRDTGISDRGTPGEAVVLWLLSGLFLLRVTAQVLVEYAGVTSLPPSREWQSGLLPYLVLLAAQIVILALMARINWQVTRRRGFFTIPRPRLAQGLLFFSILYVAVMVIRYIVSGALHPERRFWPPGVLPIIFHFVLAGYVYTLSRLARRPVLPPGTRAET